MSEARKRAARRGWSPEHDLTKPVAEGFKIGKVATLYGAEGEVKSQWVSANPDEEQKWALIRDAILEAAEPLRGLGVQAEAPPVSSISSDLLASYVIGDAHFGMFAWARESGADFDLKIAEDLMRRAMDYLVSVAPDSDEAMIVNVGDFLHIDNPTNRTPQSGHQLDVDSRWPKIVGVALRSIFYLIQKALTKHRLVHVFMRPGNHDFATMSALAIALGIFFEDCDRVIVDTTPDYYTYFRFGQTLIGITHGDTCKPQDLPNIMSVDRKEDWGQTTYRYWLTGHVHHLSEKEYPGAIVDTFRTLASSDFWARKAGYRSGREMVCDVYHREFGRLGRQICPEKMLRVA
jgi:hypothetical protein